MKLKSKAVFLDRDGVINELIITKDDGVVDSPNSVTQFKIIPGVTNALKILKKLGYKLILISNQPGVAKNYYNLKEFYKIKQKMESTFVKHQVKLDDQYYCLHHPDAKNPKYKKNCQCRKPKIKLVTESIKAHHIDLQKSFFIGDGIVDLQLAKRVKCRSIFIGNINSTILKVFQEKNISPFYIAHDLLEAAKYIKKMKNN